MSDTLPWVTDAWYAALWGERLPAGTLVARTLLDTEIVLFRGENGPAALEDCCMHRFVPLHLGNVEAGRVRCGYHGLQYDAQGACVHNPHGTGKLPAGRVRSFPAVEKHGMIWVWMGTGAADLAKVPDLSAFDAIPERYHAKRDYILVAASYRLVLDNLLDLSHVSFVHPGVIGTDDMTAVESMAVREEPDAVTVTRSWPGISISANLRRMYRGIGERADKWNDLTWNAPCNVTLSAGYTEPGAPREAGAGIISAHLLTPETRTTTHYYFSAARTRVTPEEEDENAEVLAEFSRVRRFAFEEQDAPIIAAQQRKIEAIGNRRPVLISIDDGAVRYNRILNRMLEAQHA
jgi:phenylpropionate dioxygenase-like ring-hydroxylating dioxygenase large terminal subunit